MAVAALLAVSTASASADPVADPVGPSCAVYAPESQASAGSMPGAAQQPLSMAISNNPKLSALSAALSGKLNPAVNLIGTFNPGQVTIFAPVDNAFSRLAPEAIAALQINPAWLTRLLNYHVIPGRFSPTDSTVRTEPCRAASFP